MLNLFFILFIGIFLSFEIHKLFRANLFYRITTISVYYGKNIQKKLNSNMLSLFSKIALADIIYSIITLIGIFTINFELFFILILMSFIKTFSFKYLKNINIRKLILIIDSVLSILILTIILINLLFYKIPDIVLLTNLYKQIF